MKILILVIPLLISLMIIIPSAASAQNVSSNSIGNGNNDTGGLSPESVDQASSNGTTQLLNSTGSTNDTGGLSPESVDQASSNGTTQLLNSTGSTNDTGGLSPESVTKSQY